MDYSESIWKKSKKDDDKEKLHENEIVYETYDKGAFTKFIKEKRKEYASNFDFHVYIRDYADMVGIKRSVYPKIINKTRPGQTRDCIIAICITLRMSVEDTNMALKLYNMYPQLDKSNQRESTIIGILKQVSTINPRDLSITIDDVNKRLVNIGCEPLKIIAERNYKEKKNIIPELVNKRYKILKCKAYTEPNRLIYGDQYDSLELEYDFSRYLCKAFMYLGDREAKKVLELYAGTDDSCLLIDPRNDSNSSIVAYEKASEAGDLTDYFKLLQTMASKEQHDMEACLNDTKNYGERIGAGIHNGRIHVFYETFYYSVPEFNEYYLFEYIDGIYRMTVSNKSLFMQKNVSLEEYKKHYGAPENTVKEQYDSLEEIEAQLEDDSKSLSSRILKLRAWAYKKYKTKVDECMQDLKNKNKYIRRLDWIYEGDPNRVCEFFEVEDSFECQKDPEWGTINAEKSAALFKTKDGHDIEITLDDLYKAFELGFKDIKDICDVKHELGTIEAVLD